MEILKRSNWKPKEPKPIKKKCLNCKSKILIYPNDWKQNSPGINWEFVSCPVCNHMIKKNWSDGAL